MPIPTDCPARSTRNDPEVVNAQSWPFLASYAERRPVESRLGISDERGEASVRGVDDADVALGDDTALAAVDAGDQHLTIGLQVDARAACRALPRRSPRSAAGLLNAPMLAS